MFACQTWRIDTGMGSACERQQTVSGAIIGLVHLIVSMFMCILGLYSNGHNAACLCCRAVGGVMRMGHGQVAWFMSEWPCKVCLGGWCHGLRQRWLCVGRSMHCLLLGMRKSRVSCACLQLGEDHSLFVVILERRDSGTRVLHVPQSSRCFHCERGGNLHEFLMVGACMVVNGGLRL